MLTQPIKRHGGKHYLADWILSHRPAEYVTYCEPYFGGGSVLLRHDPVNHSEVINDLDGHLANFWAVLASPSLFPELANIVAATPFSQEVFEAATQNLEDTAPGERSAIDAACFFIMSRQSRQGLCKDFATMSKSRTRRGMNEQVAQWLGAIEGLDEVHERLKRVVIFNEDALTVIGRMDHVDTWFYLDPPYPHSTRTDRESYGNYECDDQHHYDLLSMLASPHFKGKFALSGYHSREYDDVASVCGWRCVERVIDNKASSATTKPQMTECLWMNYG